MFLRVIFFEHLLVLETGVTKVCHIEVLMLFSVFYSLTVICLLPGCCDSHPNAIFAF